MKYDPMAMAPIHTYVGVESYRTHAPDPPGVGLHDKVGVVEYHREYEDIIICMLGKNGDHCNRRSGELVVV